MPWRQVQLKQRCLIVSPVEAEKKAAFYSTVPLKRGASTAEIADAIMFVASARASYITGQIIRVNGGKTAS